MEYRHGFAIYSNAELAEMDINKVIDLVKTDEHFREQMLADMDTFANSWTDRETFSAFQDRKWNYNECQKIYNGDRQAIGYWFREYVKAKTEIESRESFKEVREAERLKREKEVLANELRIPEEHKGCGLNDFPKDAQQKLFKLILKDGWSFILHGKQGIGKTRLGWVAWLTLKLQDKKTVDFLKMFELQKILLNSSMSGVQMVDYINAKFVYGLDVLIVDEVDKISMTDASFANFSYLIDRRYEEHRQTILMGNGTEEELEQKLGTSLMSRFKSNSYKSRVLELQGENKRLSGIGDYEHD